MQDPTTREAAAYLLETLTQQGDGARYEADRLTAQIFGGFIRCLRMERGMSRRQLETISDLSEPVLTAIELGYVPLNRLSNLLPRLAQALGYDTGEIQELLNEATLDAQQVLSGAIAAADNDLSLPEPIDGLPQKRGQ